MKPSDVVAFIRGHKWAVEASVATGGAPQAAVIGVAVSDAFELVFDTLGTSRKARNLRADSRIALVIGWDEGQTVQLEGRADEPAGAELEALKLVYLAHFPDGVERAGWADIAYFRVRVTWVRYSDFRGAEPRVVELEGDALGG